MSFKLSNTNRFILLILALYLSTTLAYAQEDYKSLSKKEQKEITKAKKQRLEQETTKMLVLAIDSQKWILEADRLTDRYNNTIHVNSIINFIALDKDELIIQLGSDSGLGYNGVGGVSIKAFVNKYELRKDGKRNKYNLRLFISSSYGSWDISISGNYSGGMANATIQTNSSSIKYTGKLIPTNQSNVFKGRFIP